MAFESSLEKCAQALCDSFAKLRQILFFFLKMDYIWFKFSKAKVK